MNGTLCTMYVAFMEKDPTSIEMQLQRTTAIEGLRSPSNQGLFLIHLFSTRVRMIDGPLP